MQTASMQQMPGALYMNHGLKQVYSRVGEYYSQSQLIRRLEANAIDSDAYWDVYRRVREHAVAAGRKINFEEQAFQMFAGHRAGTLEIHCYDRRSDHSISGDVKPYIIVRCTIAAGHITGFKDVVKK